MRSSHVRSFGSRILTMCLLAIMLVSMFCASAYAANTKDTYFDFSIAGVGYTEMPDSWARAKENSTAVYLYYYIGTNDYVRTRTLGAASSSGPWHNMTYIASQGMVSYVNCYKGQQYSIHNYIYESGYRWAKLAFNSTNILNSERIGGKWSPDSAGVYTSPTN